MVVCSMIFIDFIDSIEISSDICSKIFLNCIFPTWVVFGPVSYIDHFIIEA